MHRHSFHRFAAHDRHPLHGTPARLEFHPRHGRGPDGHGERPARDGMGAGGRRPRGGRMLGHGDMKILLLSLIEPQPRHGYELIRLVEGLFHGQYTPSPGVVYPSLALLEDLGHVTVETVESNRKRYSITDAGREFLAANRDSVDAVARRAEQGAMRAARYAAPPALRDAMDGVKAALAALAGRWDEASTAGAVAALRRAEADLKALGTATAPDRDGNR